MSSDAGFVFGLIAVAAALMASNRVRFDIVALLVVLALILSGTLSVNEALAGFGSPVVILVAGLLVIGEMLARTGVARAVGNGILRYGGDSETRLLVLIMLGAAFLGSAMSSTAVVAIFIPIIARIAERTGLNPSRLLLPMSFGALISGMLTLIATTPNIVVHEELKNAGFSGFGFFGFAPIGLGVLVVAILYFLLLGRRLLRSENTGEEHAPASRSLSDLWDAYRGGRDFARFRLSGDSILTGRSLGDIWEQADPVLSQLCVVAVARGEGKKLELLATPGRDTRLGANDTLVLTGDGEALSALEGLSGITRLEPAAQDRQRWLWDVGAATLLIHPDSMLVGKTLRDSDFRDRYGLEVVGLRRGGEAVTAFTETRIEIADSLLVTGAWERIRAIESRDHDFILMELPSEVADTVPSYTRMPVALTILACMVLATVFDIVPLIAAVIAAVLAAVLTRCLTMEDAYRAIPWSSIVLIAGMLPLADALEATGGTQFIVDQLMAAVGEASPYVMLSVLFWLTALLGLVLSNTASAVLVAPIAIYAANALQVSPYAFGVAVLIAASAAFSTPVSTPVVTLVVEPGRYRFTDFLKLGPPLLVLTYATTLVLAPLVFPF